MTTHVGLMVVTGDTEKVKSMGEWCEPHFYAGLIFCGRIRCSYPREIVGMFDEFMADVLEGENYIIYDYEGDVLLTGGDEYLDKVSSILSL